MSARLTTPDPLAPPSSREKPALPRVRNLLNYISEATNKFMRRRVKGPTSASNGCAPPSHKRRAPNARPGLPMDDLSRPDRTPEFLSRQQKAIGPITCATESPDGDWPTFDLEYGEDDEGVTVLPRGGTKGISRQWITVDPAHAVALEEVA